MRNAMERARSSPANQETRRVLNSRSGHGSGMVRICCGSLITPRLADIRQPDGPMIFVAVWQCPKCNRVSV